MGKKLYVGNLSYSVDGAQLEELFSKYGTVRSAEVVQDRDTGRSKGFGFVEMADDNSALEAISGLNDREQDGRRLTVNEARPKEPRRAEAAAVTVAARWRRRPGQFSVRPALSRTGTIENYTGRGLLTSAAGFFVILSEACRRRRIAGS